MSARYSRITSSVTLQQQTSACFGLHWRINQTCSCFIIPMGGPCSKFLSWLQSPQSAFSLTNSLIRKWQKLIRNDAWQNEPLFQSRMNTKDLDTAEVGWCQLPNSMLSKDQAIWSHLISHLHPKSSYVWHCKLRLKPLGLCCTELVSHFAGPHNRSGFGFNNDWTSTNTVDFLVVPSTEAQLQLPAGRWAYRQTMAGCYQIRLL